MDTKANKKKYLRVAFYIALSILVFTVSLLILPLELFLFTSVIVLITLKSIEKELSDIEKKNVSSLFGN